MLRAEEILEALIGLDNYYGSKRSNEELLLLAEMWSEDLCGTTMTTQEFKQAVAAARRQNSWHPTAKHVLDAWEGIRAKRLSEETPALPQPKMSKEEQAKALRNIQRIKDSLRAGGKL